MDQVNSSQSETSNLPNQTENINYEQDPAHVTIVREPMKVLLTWKSPARPFERKDKEFYTTAGSIIFLICVILLFVKEFLFIMAIIAFAFFYYIITSVPPEEIEHRITNKGIYIIDKLYDWGQMGRFWFDTKMGQEVLMIENYFGLPPRLLIVLGSQKKENLQSILEKYLLMEKPELGQVEKMGEWLQKKVNIENKTPPETSPQQTTPMPKSNS